jgi:hypothetical protein
MKLTIILNSFEGYTNESKASNARVTPDKPIQLPIPLSKAKKVNEPTNAALATNIHSGTDCEDSTCATLGPNVTNAYKLTAR